MRISVLLSILALLALWVGCTGSVSDDDVADDDIADDDAADDDAADDDAADDDAADDDVADDDTSDDDVADDDTVGDDDTTGGEVDDNTCDDGATSESVMQFLFQDTDEAPVAGAQWAIYDLDAHTGVLDASAVFTGVTATDGLINVTLDCAYGWMLLEVSHSANLTIHAYFQVFPVEDWVVVTMAESTATFAIGMAISSPSEGLLAVYKVGTLGNPDMQGDDSFTVDSGPNLVPASAANNLGMWIFDGASNMEMFGIWMIGADLPQAQDVAALRYHDASAASTTALNAPIWSYDDGGSNHNMTVLYVVD